MKIPNCENAIVDERKLLDYLLSETHPVGNAKARYFKKLGFSYNNAEELRHVLLKIANSAHVDQEINTAYGTKYIVKGDLSTSSGKIYSIVTIWIIEKNDINPRFVTAYPKED